MVEWRLTARGAADGRRPDDPERRASFNQDKHFTVAEEGRRASEPVASWLAVTFEIAGPLDRPALEAALLSFARRHEVLRCEFRRLAGELSCEAVRPADLVLDAVDVGRFDDPGALRAHLADSFERSIDTLAWPLFTMGAVVREDASTVYLAFDHIVCDGMSMPNVVNDVQRAYAAHAQGGSPDCPPRRATWTSPTSSAAATSRSPRTTTGWPTGGSSSGATAASSRRSRSTSASSRAGCTRS
ncbi:hypothetical protein GCM10025734_10850 [Kitasatospora paranensis]